MSDPPSGLAGNPWRPAFSTNTPIFTSRFEHQALRCGINVGKSAMSLRCLCKVSLMRGLIGGCTFLKSSSGSEAQPSFLHFESTFQLCVSSCTYCHRLCGLGM